MQLLLFLASSELQYATAVCRADIGFLYKCNISCCYVAYAVVSRQQDMLHASNTTWKPVLPRMLMSPVRVVTFAFKGSQLLCNNAGITTSLPAVYQRRQAR